MPPMSLFGKNQPQQLKVQVTLLGNLHHSVIDRSNRFASDESTHSGERFICIWFWFKRNKASSTPQEHGRGRTAPGFHHSKEDVLIFPFDSANIGKLFLWRLASRTLPADPGCHDLAGLIRRNVLSPLNEYLEQAPIPLFVLSFKNWMVQQGRGNCFVCSSGEGLAICMPAWASTEVCSAGSSVAIVNIWCTFVSVADSLGVTMNSHILFMLASRLSSFSPSINLLN